MLVCPFALCLPPLVLRRLQFVLSLPASVLGRLLQPPLRLPKRSGRDLIDLRRPAQHPQASGVEPHVAHTDPASPQPTSRSDAEVASAASDTPQTRPKSTPRRPKSFLEKTLSAREAPAQHPANTPSVPAPSPGPSAGHMPHARGTCQPIPVAPMGRPAVSLPPSARSFPASEALNLAQKIRPNRLSPARPLWGRAGERRFPPSPPRLCGPRPPRRPCTLLPRSTVTPESRS